MGEATRESLRTEGCVYLHLTGGAASYIARTIVSVEAVHLAHFGQPEAMWVFEVEDLPALVTMDSHGQSMHDEILQATAANLKSLLDKN